MLLLAVVNLSHVPVERVLGAEDDFAVAAVELLGAFVNLVVKDRSCCLLVMLRALIHCGVASDLSKQFSNLFIKCPLLSMGFEIA